jgi:type I restriction enzyme R subunit
MIEFKQIVGRGTRLFEGKAFFTIYDFVDAYHHFADPEWDGEPLEPACPSELDSEPKKSADHVRNDVDGGADEAGERRKKIKIKLRDGKEREIDFMMATSFWGAEGKIVSSEEFLQNLFGELPNFLKSEAELREIWSSPITRAILLDKLEEAGFGKANLTLLQKAINAEKSDFFDVLAFVLNHDTKPISRESRVIEAHATIFERLNEKEKVFIDFVLSKYIETGVDELDQEKLPILLTNQYHSLHDAQEALGEVATIRSLFITFQRALYQRI